MAKAELHSAVANEHGRFEGQRAQARNEVQNEVGQAQGNLLRREASLSDHYSKAEKGLDDKMKEMEAFRIHVI